jgi:hypothetical protein
MLQVIYKYFKCLIHIHVGPSLFILSVYINTVLRASGYLRYDFPSASSKEEPHNLWLNLSEAK